MDSEENKRHPVELSDILKSGISVYKQNMTLHPFQEKAVNDILSCRSNLLGGHTIACNHCGYTKTSYNSCRNRHCPKCQYVKGRQWLDKVSNLLLPCKHYHVVFTIPKELHRLFYLNQRKCYNLLFQASQQAIQKVCLNGRFLGAQTGGLSILHTWTQTLNYHPHIHMLVPDGGLSEDGIEWIKSRSRFLVPYKVLSRIFRGTLIRKIQDSIDKGELKLPIKDQSFTELKRVLYQKDWNVHLENTFSGIKSVLNYLARYTHRVAIANSRFVVSNKADTVSFWYKAGKKRKQSKVMTLDNQEFIRRYLQHILPLNFYKIRYFGIIAAYNVKNKKEQCLALLNQVVLYPTLHGLTSSEIINEIFRTDIFGCPICKKGRLINTDKPPD